MTILESFDKLDYSEALESLYIPDRAKVVKAALEVIE